MRFARTFPIWKISANFRAEYGIVIEDTFCLRGMWIQLLSLLILDAGVELEGVDVVWVMIAAKYGVSDGS